MRRYFVRASSLGTRRASLRSRDAEGEAHGEPRAGGGLNADYVLPATALHLGATYYGAYGFGVKGLDPEKNPEIDNTLPVGSTSTSAEVLREPRQEGSLSRPLRTRTFCRPSATDAAVRFHVLVARRG